MIPPAAPAISPKAGPPDSGIQAPAVGAAGGISGHGAWRRRADAGRAGLAGRAAVRGTGPGQAGGDVHLVFACDDDQDTVG
jgi:hypothetical protein